MTLSLPVPDLLAVVTGESIVAFVPRGAVEVGDEVRLAAAGSRTPGEVKPAYAGWVERAAPDGAWWAAVEDVLAASALDPREGASRHVLAGIPDGDLLVLRVHGEDGPVLSDTAFAARRRSLDGALGR